MLETVTTDTIAEAQDGNVQAITEIYERYHSSVFRYLYYRLGDRETAEDLTSEVFLKMMRALPDYRQQTAPFQAWLFQIARFLSIDHFRKNNHRQEVELTEIVTDQNPRIDTIVAQKLNAELLQQFLGKLPTDQREVLVMRFLVGMPITEVARVLHKSDDAIKGLQRRGLITMRLFFEKMEITYD